MLSKFDLTVTVLYNIANDIIQSNDGYSWLPFPIGLTQNWQLTWPFTLLLMFLFSLAPFVYYLRITMLKRTYEHQKRFTEQLINSQEKERRRIAMELHDGLGQQILVMKNRAELARQEIKGHNKISRQLDEIMDSANICISDVRNLSQAMRPIYLEKFGLTEAIENLCRQLQHTSKIEWSFHIDNIEGLIPKSKEIHLYRILQEATNNIQKHSYAKEASIMLRRSPTVIRSTIWDDGKGFDKKNDSVNKGLGISGMFERIETMGGKISIDTKLDEGTVIKIEIPRS